MKHSLCISITALLLTTSFQATSQPLPEGPRLKELADQAGIMIGVRAYLNNDAQKTVVEREFNTSTRTCYPFSINRKPDQNDLESFNLGVNWLYERNMQPMHHMLFGPTQYEPKWVSEITSPDELEKLMKERIEVIMEANDNASKVNVWNVVNETFNWDMKHHGAYFTEEKLIWVKMGFEDDKSGLTGEDKINDSHPVYIRKAFEYADQYTDGKLELRDNTCETPNRKMKALYQLVLHLRNSGVRIDGVGLQCHYNLEDNKVNAEGLAAVIRAFKKIGLEVYLNEIDISSGNLPWTPEVAELQKQEYKKLITVALEEGVQQIHFWGLQDGDENWLRDKNPLLFDGELNPKPAYYGVQEALIAFLKK